MVLRLLSYLPDSAALLQLILHFSRRHWFKKIKSGQSLAQNPPVVFLLWSSRLYVIWPLSALLVSSPSPLWFTHSVRVPLPCFWCLNVPSMLLPQGLWTDCLSTWQGNIFIQTFAWLAPSPHSGLCSNGSSSGGFSPSHHALYLVLILSNLNIIN